MRVVKTILAILAPSLVYAFMPFWSYAVRGRNFFTWNESYLWLATGLASGAAVAALLHFTACRTWRRTSVVAAAAALLPAGALAVLIMTGVVFAAPDDLLPFFALGVHMACAASGAVLCRLPGRWLAGLLAAGLVAVVAVHLWQYDLRRAASEGDTSRLRLILGIFPNHPEKSAALFLAAWSGHRDAVDLLLERGANVAAHERETGWTPLHAACAGGGPGAARKNLSAVREILVDRGADVNALDAHGRTPLFHAVMHSHDTVEFLLACGADVDARDNHGTAPIHLAVRNGQDSTFVVGLLMASGADLAGTDDSGRTVLHYLATNPYYLSEPMLRFLLAHDLDINARDNDGATPLHLAVGGGLDSGAARIRGNLDGVRTLLRNGADARARDNAGRTPLHTYAIGNVGHLDLLRLLVAFGADTTARDNAGKTPLDLAIEAGAPDVIWAFRRYEPGEDHRKKKWQDGPDLLPGDRREHAWDEGLPARVACGGKHHAN